MPFRSRFGKKNRGETKKYNVVNDDNREGENDKGINVSKQPADGKRRNTSLSSSPDLITEEAAAASGPITASPDIIFHRGQQQPPPRNENNNNKYNSGIEIIDRTAPILNRHASTTSSASTLSTGQINCDEGIEIDIMSFGSSSSKDDDDDSYGAAGSVLTEHTESTSSTFSYLNDLGKGHRTAAKTGKTKGNEEDHERKGTSKPHLSITFEQYNNKTLPTANHKQKQKPRLSKQQQQQQQRAPSQTSLTPSTKSANKRRSRSALRNAAAIAERNYWKDNLSKCVVQYGPVHNKIADCLICLGGAHMKCKEYNEALSVFKSTVRIQRQIHGSDHLSVGRALDRVGLAASFGDAPHNHDWAIAALKEAFLIRYNHLGPYHCDTADTLNNIGGVHLRRNELDEARKAYEEVLTVRAAILGRDHPAVAVTAHALGKVYMRQSNHSEALRHFEFSLRIYREALRLKDTNPTVAKVLKDKDSVERIMVSKGYR